MKNLLFLLFIGFVIAVWVIARPLDRIGEGPAPRQQQPVAAKNPPTPSTPSSPPPIEPAKQSRQITLEMYGMMKEGISYDEARAVIGFDGEELSSNVIRGAPGVIEDVHTVAYSWKNWDGSNMLLMFQNDRLMSRSQFGLK
jgi:hypothetical protein